MDNVQINKIQKCILSNMQCLKLKCITAGTLLKNETRTYRQKNGNM
jgi:hypothetical protein